METRQNQYTAFVGNRRIASGSLANVAFHVKEVLDQGELEPLLVFDELTGHQVDLDLRGTPAEVLTRLTETDVSQQQPDDTPQKSGPGRPKLGVVAREVTLLPRHWEWLNSQPGGASVALRKLVERARRDSQGADRARTAQDAAYRFMNTMAGNLPGYEDALRAFYAGDYGKLNQISNTWPVDIRDYLQKLVQTAAQAAEEAKKNTDQV